MTAATSTTTTIAELPGLKGTELGTSEWLEVTQERVNSFFAVPTMLYAMAREPGFDSRDLSALRSVNAAGAPLPLPTLTLRSEIGRAHV